MLVFYLSVKSLISIAISQLIGVSENIISDWQILLHTQNADWLGANPFSLGGQGIILELREAKFGKRKYNKGAYREGKWVLGGVDIVRGQCWASRMVPQIVHLKIPILHAYKMILFLLYGLVKLLKGFLSQT